MRTSDNPVLELVTSKKFIFFVCFASDKKEASLAAKVDFPEPEFPNINIFFDFNNLEKSFDASFLDNSLKNETLPSSKLFSNK